MNQFSTTPSASRPQRQRRSPGLPTLLSVLAAIVAIAPAAWADTTDLATQPLLTLTTVTAKPNLLFVMDSSGSMNWSYMPDDLGLSNNTADQPYNGTGGQANWYGYWSAQCNGVAFDPTASYPAPVTRDGKTLYANAVFTKAPVDGYAYAAGTNNSTTNLTNSYYYQYNSSGAETVMGWTYTTSGVTKNNFYNECASAVGSTPGSGVFTKTNVTAAQQQAYANWYSYYSHRYLLMRSAMGTAISKLNSNYRVGFSTIYDTTAIDGKAGTNFVDVKDFDATQMGKFYDALYAVTPNGGTNLPDALAEAGHYFAHKISGQSEDPVQYACQRNFTLMSTDGYWNTNSKDFGLDGNRVGEQDDTEARPMKDGTGDSTTKTVTKFTAPITAKYTSNQLTQTVTWTRKSTSSVAGPGTGNSTSVGNCTKSGYFIVNTLTQTATENQYKVSVAPHTASATYTETVLATNGVTTSDTSTAVVTTWNSPGAAVYTYNDKNTTSGVTSQPNGNTIDPPAGSYSAGSTAQTGCVKPKPAATGPDRHQCGHHRLEHGHVQRPQRRPECLRHRQWPDEDDPVDLPGVERHVGRRGRVLLQDPHEVQGTRQLQLHHVRQHPGPVRMGCPDVDPGSRDVAAHEHVHDRPGYQRYLAQPEQPRQPDQRPARLAQRHHVRQCQQHRRPLARRRQRPRPVLRRPQRDAAEQRHLERGQHHCAEDGLRRRGVDQLAGTRGR